MTTPVKKSTTYWTSEQAERYSSLASGSATAKGEPSLMEAFRSMASEIAEMDFSHVKEDDVIADLGMDSLSMLELVGELERTYDVRVPEEQLVAIRTVRELLAVVEEQRA